MRGDSYIPAAQDDQKRVAEHRAIEGQLHDIAALGEK
jgi:hypothetical protein